MAVRVWVLNCEVWGHHLFLVGKVMKLANNMLKV